MFVPATAPAPARFARFVVLAPRGLPADTRSLLGGAIQSALPGNQATIRSVTLETLYLRDIGEARFQGPIVTALGVLALALAGVGVFGTVSFLVAQRTHELGIRVALGASPGDIWRSVVLATVGTTLAGLGVGSLSAWMLESVVASTVFGWTSSGSGALSLVAGAILSAAVLAASIPAGRASRIDPASALRAE